MDSSNTFNSRILILGRIQRSKGLNGDIRVTTFGEILSMHKSRMEVFLYSGTSVKDGFIENAEHKETVHIDSIKEIRNNGVIILRFQEYTKKEDIDRELKGLYIGLDLEFAKIYYSDHKNPWLFQWIDMELFDSSDLSEPVGTILSVSEFSGKVLFRLRLKSSKDVLIPVEYLYDADLDWDQNKVHAEGLLDLISSMNDD